MIAVKYTFYAQTDPLVHTTPVRMFKTHIDTNNRVDMNIISGKDEGGIINIPIERFDELVTNKILILVDPEIVRQNCATWGPMGKRSWKKFEEEL